MDRMLIFGGTGSLGKTLIAHFIGNYEVYVFSRDEAKHVAIKQMYPAVKSLIGDIRDRDAVVAAMLRVKPQIVINAAALKNVPEVEEVPMEGIKTSLIGTENVTVAARMMVGMNSTGLRPTLPIKILTVSTDKACHPVNSYGMAKALQERLHIRSNGDGLVCNAVRYGNVLESRGSLIPLIKEKFKNDESVCITHPDMTRFFLTLDSSVELIKTALDDNEGGKTFIPQIRSARIADVVDVFRRHYGRDDSKVTVGSIRPGEKIDEVLISREELLRTEKQCQVYVVHDILTTEQFANDLHEELSSGSVHTLLFSKALIGFLTNAGLLND